MFSDLQLFSTVLAAHHVTAGAERGIDLFLAAQHAQQRLPQFLQLLLQQPALLAAPAVQRPLLFTGRRAGRRSALPRPRHHVHDSGVVQRASGVVVHFLGGPPYVKYILLAQVDVLIEEKRSQVTLEIPAVLHHDGVRYRVTPVDKNERSVSETAYYTLAHYLLAV